MPRYDMNLFFVTDTGVEVTVKGQIDGVEVITKDGDFKSRTVYSADDSVELANMFARAAQHVRELNQGKPS